MWAAFCGRLLNIASHNWKAPVRRPARRIQSHYFWHGSTNTDHVLHSRKWSSANRLSSLLWWQDTASRALLVFLTRCIREWTRFRNQDVPAASVAFVSGKTGRWRHSEYIGLVSLTRRICFMTWYRTQGRAGLLAWVLVGKANILAIPSTETKGGVASI